MLLLANVFMQFTFTCTRHIQLLELLAGKSMCSVIGLWLNSVSIQYAAKSPSGLHPWGLLAVVFVS